jgi:hypothetical protein
LLDYLKSNAVDAARHSVLIKSLADGIDELRLKRKQVQQQRAEREKADEVALLEAQLQAAKARVLNETNINEEDYE